RLPATQAHVLARYGRRPLRSAVPDRDVPGRRARRRGLREAAAGGGAGARTPVRAPGGGRVVRCLPMRRAARDASLVTGALAGAIYLGSAGEMHLDPALFGYLGATLVATFGVVHRASAFWRRPASAVYARAALAALRHPRRLPRAVRSAAEDLATQRFIARRGRLRWLAHIALSLGTLASFAITLPLVWGWLRFEGAGQDRYQVRLVGLP